MPLTINSQAINYIAAACDDVANSQQEADH